jgi:prepilin-type N-terminal cleavage/methylation domain-containing protein
MSSRARGFTLLEVMVSLALLAAALMAMADLSGGALRNHAYARDLSAATLLTRGKIAELEQKYEDQGFKDFDETEEGDFHEEGRPDMRWRLQLVKPDPNLAPEQLVALLAGASSGDPQELIGKLVGSATGAAVAGAAGATAAAGATPAAGAPVPAKASSPASIHGHQAVLAAKFQCWRWTVCFAPSAKSTAPRSAAARAGAIACATAAATSATSDGSRTSGPRGAYA